ncbi:ATPase, T2SS/T4P/T4SS family [Paenibacillus sp. GbtcB18]|uniref:ATPase, T2SS/T4P/T4SS family n=1 Tax=Paenibacillus sp. GbtcB18 TaxID=2824763 RepID=UPI001C307175|nr:ATPase, T2SS/T4P/T4SS family [Paenibacillus sp. GbtcB18]
MPTDRLNLALILIVTVFAVMWFFAKTGGWRVRTSASQTAKNYSIEAMTAFIKEAFAEITAGGGSELRLSEEEYRRSRNKRLQLKRALKGCGHGDLKDKRYVKSVMTDLLTGVNGLGETTIHHSLPFHKPEQLTAQDRFDILLHLYRKKYGYDGLHELIRKHKLDAVKHVIEDGRTPSYIVTAEEIAHVFRKEAGLLSFQDKLEIVVQRIYQHYKGFGVIDTIREMRIDGVSGGVSGALPDNTGHRGSPLAEREAEGNHRHKKESTANDSVWIFYRGKPIHFSFLSFGSSEELRRVCQNIYKYNYPGQLSETNGYKVNDMKDGSRVVVVRPPFSESWAFFVRKFDLPNAMLDQLVQGGNAGLAVELIRHLVKGCRITAVTGAQGSGKTTLLMAMVQSISATLTLRVQEMAYELHLRNLYPQRNILSFRETDHITGQQGLDVQKKTDGAVHILGEVATDTVAAWMIQMAQVASLFTLFTHHAKTFASLIDSLRNSLLKTGMFQDEVMAEKQVIRVIHFDIHLRKSADGTRFIERITECVPLDSDSYPSEKAGMTDKDTVELPGFLDDASEFFRRTTDRKLYEQRNIVEYRDGAYRVCRPISLRNTEEMLDHMTPADARAFERFLETHWGGDVIAAS